MPVAQKLIEKYGHDRAQGAITNISLMLDRIKHSQLAKVGASFSIEDGLNTCCESSSAAEDKFFFLFMLSVMNIMVAREAKERLIELQWTPDQMKAFYDGIQLLAAHFVDSKETKKMLLFTGVKPVSGGDQEES